MPAKKAATKAVAKTTPAKKVAAKTVAKATPAKKTNTGKKGQQKLSVKEISKTKLHVGTQHLPSYTNETYTHKELKPLTKEQKTIVRYSDAELEEFKTLINEKLRKAKEEVEKLNPKPGGSFDSSSRVVEQIVPDFTIRIVDGELELSLNGRNAPLLHVSKDYQDMLQTYKDSRDKSNAQKDAVQFIKQKLDSAKWFIDAIKQRQETLYVTMNAIMHYQKEYFLEGEETKLRPMILKDIADMVGLDISTVSRVANSKYVQTEFGIFLLKHFFSEALQTDSGEEVSTREVKKILQNIIDSEEKSKPKSDEDLTELLKEKGYNIARRTVAKYREQLNIPVARLRKEL